ncbi:MAG: DNA gyrase/topoisomerase IV subunit A [Christensenellales bacterium]|jgi:DNA gyrase subunit A|nr:DNA topoisomerase 4 subunit A [Clostridiales bacterium]
MAKKKTTQMQEFEPQILSGTLEEVMHNSMMPYAEHVILERAIPRVEDGLKPVQRRILYTMMELGLSPDKPHRKCARIVGDCLGKYHPHGDSSVYDALVRLAQPFSMRAPLVDGHGNFGSIDGDMAAAMRYTEARMTPLALEMLRDIHKDTVPFRLNFDDTLQEPDVLPARYPNLLVNGASGIAVGLATNIPTHNLRETIQATTYLIDNHDATLDELMQFIPAPDFPTGGYLLKTPAIREAYETGRAKLTVRGKVDIEKGRSGKHLLCITELPYQVNKAQLLEKILKLSEDKKDILSGISDIRDESDRTGMRAVIELKKDVDPEVILGVLYKYSDLQVTFGVNMVVIADGKPKQLGLKPVLSAYIQHQKEVVLRRTRYDLNTAEAREHILEGLMIAVDALDETIALIRASKNGKEARTRLCERFELTEIQAQAILDLRLQRLTNLEILELRKEYEEILKIIKRLKSILKSEKKLLEVIKTELSEVAEKYGDDRRTQLIKEDKELKAKVEEHEMPVPENTVVSINRGQRIIRLSQRNYERMEAPETPDDLPLFTFRTMTDRTLWLFTSLGNCFRLEVAQLQESTRTKDRGISLAGVLVGLQDDENIVAAFDVNSIEALPFDELIFVTKKGLIKSSVAQDYDLRRSKFIAIKLGEKDELLAVFPAHKGSDCWLISQNAMLIRFNLSEVPVTGRATRGVIGIRLSPDDALIGCGLILGDEKLLLMSDRGFAKRIVATTIDPQRRGGKGMRAFTFNKNGGNGRKLAGAIEINDAGFFTVVEHSGKLSTYSSMEVAIQSLKDRGKLYVVDAVLDNTVDDILTQN